jgi:hypothetical protein
MVVINPKTHSTQKVDNGKFAERRHRRWCLNITIGSDMKVRVGAANFIFLNPNLRSNVPQQWRNRPTNEESFGKAAIFLGNSQIYGKQSGWVASSILALRAIILPRVEMNVRNHANIGVLDQQGSCFCYFSVVVHEFFIHNLFETCLVDFLPDHTLLLISPCQSFPCLTLLSIFSWSHSALILSCSRSCALLSFSALPLLFLSFHTPHTHVYTHMCTHTHTHTHTHTQSMQD